MSWSNDGIENAVIESTDLNIENGWLDSWLHVTYGNGTEQGFGGRVLYKPGHTSGPPFAGAYLSQLLRVCGVTHWDKLKGRAIRVHRQSGIIVGIGHIIEDIWLYPKDLYEELVE